MPEKEAPQPTKPNNDPPDVKEPSNVRPPSKPTPDQTPEPQEADERGALKEKVEDRGE